MAELLEPLDFRFGGLMPNRLALAPLTNLQSGPDGCISPAEHRWLTLRAEGGFGLVMTCASHVQPLGQGFAGQLGVFGDQHIEGLSRLATDIRRQGSLAFVQLHHAGARSPIALIGQPPVAPSADSATGARALATGEVETLIEDFVAAAARCRAAGFDGVELHGAHGYILTQFLSQQTNRRTDRYGGGLENRARLLMEIIAGIRARCGTGFGLGLRLSPEKFGLRLADMRQLAAELLAGDALDFLDLSLLVADKSPDEPEFADRSLIDWFTDLPRGNSRLGVAGSLTQPEDAARCLKAGADFVLVGRSAILHPDYPRRIKERDFRTTALPVPTAYLEAQGLTAPFINYMRSFPGFVSD